MQADAALSSGTLPLWQQKTHPCGAFFVCRNRQTNSQPSSVERLLRRHTVRYVRFLQENTRDSATLSRASA
ncbi:hypothetical protein D3Z52_07745 [Clostridiaceae bacterium]|nr:hypothetical protein [Clostridiaceae bacterium]